jgi:hypothetical protein
MKESLHWVVNKVALDDAVVELNGLRDRASLDKTRGESMANRPVSGVIAASNAVSGQTFEPTPSCFRS